MKRNEQGEQVEDLLIADPVNFAIKRLTFTKNDRNEYIPSKVKVLAGGIPASYYNNSKKASQSWIDPKLLTISEGSEDDEKFGGEIYFYEEREGGMITKIDRNGDLQLIVKSTSSSPLCGKVSLEQATFGSITDMKYSREGTEEVLYLVDSNQLILRASLTRMEIEPITSCIKAVAPSDDPERFFEIYSIFPSKNTIDNKVVLYVADHYTMKKIDPSGEVKIISGKPVPKPFEVDIIYPHKIFVNADGDIIFLDASSVFSIKKLDMKTLNVSTIHPLFGPLRDILQSPLTGNIYFEDHNRIEQVKENEQTSIFGNGQTFEFVNGAKAIQARINPVSFQLSSKSGKDVITLLDNFQNFKSVEIDENQIIQTKIGGGGFKLQSFEKIEALQLLLKDAKYSFRSNNGDHFIVMGSSVYQLNNKGILNRVIGSTSKFGGDGHVATSALLNEPSGVFYSKSLGKTFIADTKNSRIRVISKEGVISTLVGVDSTVDDKLRIEPVKPKDVFERNGVLYFSSQFAIIKLDLATNDLQNVIGQASNVLLHARIDAEGIYVTEEEDIYFADKTNHIIQKWSKKSSKLSIIAGTRVQGSSQDGLLATNSTIDSPTSVYLNSKGEVYFVESKSHKIRKITSDGKLLTLFQVRLPHRLIVTSTDDVIVSHDAFITKYSSNEAIPIAGSRMKSYPSFDTDPLETYFGSVVGLSFGETESDLIFANPKFDLIRQIAKGSLSNIVGGNGDGLKAKEAIFKDISSVLVTPENEFFISDTRDHTIRKVSRDGFVSTIAGISQLHGYNLYNPKESILNVPNAITRSENGDLFFIDQMNYVIRKISKGITSTIIGTPTKQCDLVEGKKGSETCLSMPQGLAVSPKGDVLIFTDLSTHGIFEYKLNDENAIIRRIAGFKDIIGYNGDGDVDSTLISKVSSLAFSNDNLSFYFIDDSNNMVRKMSPYCPEGFNLSNQLKQCMPLQIEKPTIPEQPNYPMNSSMMSGMMRENLMIMILVAFGSALVFTIVVGGAIYHLLKNKESQKYYHQVENKDEIPLEEHDDIEKYSLGADLEDEEEIELNEINNNI